MEPTGANIIREQENKPKRAGPCTCGDGRPREPALSEVEGSKPSAPGPPSSPVLA
jgi:hypothetical protein